MKRLSLFLAILALPGCTTVYERGQKLAVIGSNVEAMTIKTPAGTTFIVAKIDNAAVHRAAGASVANGAAGIGAGVATSGILTLFK